MSEQHCSDAIGAFFRITQANGEQNFFYTKDVPASYTLKPLIGQCFKSYWVDGYYGAANTRSSSCNQIRYWTKHRVNGQIIGLEPSILTSGSTIKYLAIKFRTLDGRILFSYPKSTSGTFIRVEPSCRRVSGTNLGYALDIANGGQWQITNIATVDGSSDDCGGCELKITDIRGVVFEKIYEDECPTVDVICRGKAEKCPEHTCKVDCKNHWCCYDRNGIPQKIIAK